MFNNNISFTGCLQQTISGDAMATTLLLLPPIQCYCNMLSLCLPLLVSYCITQFL